MLLNKFQQFREPIDSTIDILLHTKNQIGYQVTEWGLLDQRSEWQYHK